MVDRTRPLFPLGQVVATPAALDALATSQQSAIEFLDRHIVGDWGDVGKADARTNDAAVKHGERLLSSYKTKAGTEIWIITEWDRSVTTVLLPDDY